MTLVVPPPVFLSIVVQGTGSFHLSNMIGVFGRVKIWVRVRVRVSVSVMVRVSQEL